MKKNFKAIASYVIILTGGFFVLSSCVADPDSSGLEFAPDMYRSPAVEPYVDYGFVRDKENKELKVLQSSLRPAHNTIPYYGASVENVSMMLPYQRLASSAASISHGLYEKDGWRLSDSLSADYNNAKADKNPIVLTAENSDAIFDSGKKLYKSMCMHCHGEKGKGEGSMVQSGAYAGVPDYANLKELGDGQIFYSIYYGKGSMGAHSMMLDKEEIWTLVHYVNKFRFDDYGNLDVSEENNSEDDVSEIDENLEEMTDDTEQD